MKNLKKIIALVLCLALAFAFAACGKTDKEDDGKLKTAEAGKLIMATNATFPPYEYYEGKDVVGIDADVAALIAEKLGLKLEIQDVEFDSTIPGVQQGKYDIGMAGITVNEDRQRKVSFSDPYATGVQVVIVKEGSAIKSIDDLSEKTKIGVQQGTVADTYASDTPENGGYGEDAVVRYSSGALAVEGLKAGKVDCVIIDNEPAKAYVAANEGLKILDGTWVEENYAICFAKENTALQTAVNNALKELIADGSVQKVVDKYIKADK